MEEWNGGMMGLKSYQRKAFFITQYSIIPIFQLQGGPRGSGITMVFWDAI
jgi:hypothetical protein